MGKENLPSTITRREFAQGSLLLNLVLPTLMTENSNSFIKKLALDVLRQNYPSWQGLASWYSTKKGECLGCSEELIMANGDKLTDYGACTIACNRVPLNSLVVVHDPERKTVVLAKVTDNGGRLESGDRLADLNLETRDALQIDPDQGETVIEIIELPCQGLLQTII